MTYRERLLAWETNYGREAGWDVELDGRKIVFLDDPRREEMFWDSYRATATDPVAAGRLQDKAFWYEGDAERFVYRSRSTGTVAPLAFPGPIVGPDRIMMRALYINAGAVLPWDFVVLCMRRRLRQRQIGARPVAPTEER